MPSSGKGGAGDEPAGGSRVVEGGGPGSGNIIRPRTFTAPPPDPAEALYYEGMAAYQHRNWPLALERFSRLKELQPGRPGLDALLDEARWFIQLQAASPAAVAAPEPGTAARQAADPISPRWTRRLPMAALILVAIAAIAFLVWGGRLPWAGATAREAQDLYARAETRLAVGDYEGARALYQKLLGLQPGDPEAQLGLERAERQQQLAQDYAAAEAAIAEEEWDQASIELEHVLSTDPHYADAQSKAELVAQRRRLASLYGEGSRLFDEAKWEDAAEQFERIREMDDSYRAEAVAQVLFSCYLNAADKILSSPGLTVARIERATELYRLALEIHPHNQTASEAHRLTSLFLLAARWLSQGEYDKAATQLQTLLSENASFAGGEPARQLYSLYLHDARTAESLGDYPKALMLYRRARAVPGTDTSVAAERERIIAAYTPTPTPTPTRPATATATPLPEGIVRARTVMRGGPGAAWAPAGQLEAGAKLTITGRSADGLWYRVETAEGQTGWLASVALELRGESAGVAVITPQPPPTKPATATLPAPRATPTPFLVTCLAGQVRDAAGSAPLTGWSVTLSSGSSYTAGATNAAGQYRFADLPAGVYTISVVAESGWFAASPASATVTLTPGTACVTVDFWFQRAAGPVVEPTPPR